MKTSETIPHFQIAYPHNASVLTAMLFLHYIPKCFFFQHISLMKIDNRSEVDVTDVRSCSEVVRRQNADKNVTM